MVSHFEGRRIFAVYASLSICTRFFICALQFRINEKKKRKFMYIRSMKISRDWKTWSSINCIINTYWQYWLDIDHFLLRIEQQYFLYEIRNHDSYYCSSLLFLWFLLSFILFFWNEYLNIIANLLIFVHLKISSNMLMKRLNPTMVYSYE